MVTTIFSLHANLGNILSFVAKPLSVCRKIFSSSKVLSLFDDSSPTNPISETASFRRWDELDRDVMELIIQRLNLPDTIRLKNVCKSWRSLFSQDKVCKYPFLVLPQENCQSLRCVCVSDGSINNFKLPFSIRLDRGRYSASSKGWLFFKQYTDIFTSKFSFKTKAESYIFMFNPNSGRLVRLPPLSTIPQWCEEPDILVKKIELSSPDPSTCIVAAAFRLKNGKVLLAFCQPGNKHWSVFNDKDDGFLIGDVLFLNGELCVLCYMREEEEVEDIIVKCCIFKLGDNDRGEEVRLRIIPYSSLQHEEDHMPVAMVVNENFEIVTNYRCCEYLAESANGELLLIRRFYDKVFIFPDYPEEQFEHVELDGLEEFEELEGGDFEEPEQAEEMLEEEFQAPEEEGIEVHEGYETTRKFVVFTVDLITGNLSEIKCLGDQVIFVSFSGSVVLGATSYLRLEPNGVYFTEDGWIEQIANVGSPEVGIYKLQEGRICQCVPTISSLMVSKMGWFTVEAHSNNLF